MVINIGSIHDARSEKHQFKDKFWPLIWPSSGRWEKEYKYIYKVWIIIIIIIGIQPLGRFSRDQSSVSRLV